MYQISHTPYHHISYSVSSYPVLHIIISHTPYHHIPHYVSHPTAQMLFSLELEHRCTMDLTTAVRLWVGKLRWHLWHITWMRGFPAPLYLRCLSQSSGISTGYPGGTAGWRGTVTGEKNLNTILTSALFNQPSTASPVSSFTMETWPAAIP